MFKKRTEIVSIPAGYEFKYQAEVREDRDNYYYTIQKVVDFNWELFYMGKKVKGSTQTFKAGADRIEQRLFVFAVKTAKNHLDDISLEDRFNVGSVVTLPATMEIDKSLLTS